MARRTVLVALGELAVWWTGLLLLWLVLISTVDPLELLVGTGIALAGAVAARAGRRVVTWR
ncbi:hypothetical protein ACWD4G_32770 [Streptomyces sp. NPDC002643]